MGLALIIPSPVSIHTSTQIWPFTSPHFPAHIGGAPTRMCLDLVFLCAMIIEVRGIWVMQLRVRLGVCMCEHVRGQGGREHLYIYIYAYSYEPECVCSCACMRYVFMCMHMYVHAHVSVYI